MRNHLLSGLVAVMLTATAVLSGCSGGNASAEAAAEASAYVNEETLAVMVFDLERVDVDAMVAKLKSLLPESMQAGLPTGEGLDKPKSKIDELRAAGAKRLIMVADTDDQMTMVIPMGPGADEKKLIAAFELDDPSGEIKRVGNAIVARKDGSAAARPASAARFTQIQKALAAVDSRTINVAILKPKGELPVPPQAKMMFGTLMDDFVSISIAVDVTPQAVFDMVVQASDAAAAAAMEKERKAQLTEASTAMGMAENAELKATFAKVNQLLAPKVSGDQLRLSLGEAEIRTLVEEFMKIMVAAEQ